MREPVEANLSIAELLQKLAAETSLLVRQEIDLARAEIACTLKATRKPAASFGVTILFALGAFGALTALIIAAIATTLPVWAASLIVTVLYAVVAGIAAALGKSALANVDPIPRQTINTIKDDVRTVRSSLERSH
jgi:uncharacterized membrane protein YqjE